MFKSLIMFFKAFGKNPSGKYLDTIKKSFNYKKGEFRNLSDTPMLSDDTSYWEVLKKYFKKDPNLKPPSPLPSVSTNLREINCINPVIVWFGHSSYFIKIENINILVDPVFSGYASPLPFMIKAFPGADAYTTDNLPVIDCLILTHDHYDHMDYKTIVKLKSAVKNIYCSLGLLSHLTYWGFNDKNIVELDWWQPKNLNPAISLTATPARHFSGRGVKRNKTLWSSFILKTASHNLYLGGDSGYDVHFKEIGNNYGPFDMVILEDGQYNTAWPYIHMMLEETIQAAIDLGAKVLLPVHWAKFPLSLHAWNEPIIRLLKAAAIKHLKVTTPMIGEPVILDEVYPQKEWWSF